jgi:hypothetical protein
MNQIKQFFTSQYLFQINRLQLETSDKVFFIVGLTSLVLAIVSTIFARLVSNPAQQKLVRKLSHSLWFLGLAETIWFGARYQFVYFFGSHFFALLLLLVWLVWLVFILKYALTGYRRERLAWQKEQIKRKYL